MIKLLKCCIFTGEQVKKKWRNVKDTYAKELVIQKKAVKGRMKKKRPYRYAAELSFLSGQFMEREPQSSESSDDDGDFATKPRKKRTRSANGTGIIRFEDNKLDFLVHDTDDEEWHKWLYLVTDSGTLASNLVIDVATLIQEVKSRPILWNKQSQISERNERDLRDKLWGEICEALFENWNELRSSAKLLQSKFVFNPSRKLVSNEMKCERE